MATLYVRSTDGNDADNGSTWALAKQSIAGALAAAAAGDTIYVSQAHAFSAGAAITWTSPGTAASPVKIICVNDSAEPPTTVATGAYETVSINAAFNHTGYTYIYGVEARPSTGAQGNFNYAPSSVASYSVYDNFTFYLLNGSNSVVFGQNNLTTRANKAKLINPIFRFSGVGNKIIPRCSMEIIGGSFHASSSVPTVLFSTPDLWGCTVDVYGMDLSTLGTGKSWVSPGNSATILNFYNCKEGSGHSHVSASIDNPSFKVNVFNRNGLTAYRYQGTISPEPTIVRSGGAQNAVGSFSYKMETNTNANICWPLELEFGPVYWNEVTGSAIDIEIPIITDNVTLTNAEAWIQVEFLGTSGQVISSFSHDSITDMLATPANQTTDSVSSWTTTGLTTPVQQKLSVSITPQEEGLIHVHVYLARASTIMYLDPVIRSGAKQYMLPLAGVANDPSSTGGTTTIRPSFIKTGGQL